LNLIDFLFLQEEWRDMHAFLEAGAENGWLKPHVGKEYTLDQASQTHIDIITNTGTTGKLVIKL
jgi:NADPH2:quinone reductase